MGLRRALWQGGALALVVGALAVMSPRFASGADHIDSTAATGEPLADIGDVFAWMDGTAANLNMVITLGGLSEPASFGTAVTYVFHINRGAAYGATPDETRVMCQFADSTNLECWVRDLSGATPTTVAYVAGNPDNAAGIASEAPTGLRVYAGLRNDPFYFNFDGFQDAVTATRDAASMPTPPFTFDANGCPLLDGTPLDNDDTVLNTDNVVVDILTSDSPPVGMTDRVTPATNDLAGINTQAIVVQLDKTLIAGTGDILAVWAATHRAPSL